MPLDYKYIDHDNPPGKNFVPRLLLRLLIVFILIAVGLYTFFYIQTRRVEDWILTGQYDRTEQRLSHWTFLPIVSGRVHEKLGTAKLLHRGAAAAATDFQTAQSKWFFKPAGIWLEVLKTLWANARYSDGTAYANHIASSLKEDPIVHFYNAGFLTGLNQLDDASKELAAAGNIPDYANEITTLKAEINQRQTTGAYVVIFDREKFALANRSFKGETTVRIDSLKPILNNPSFGYLATHKDRNEQAVLTLDYRIQNAALNALGKYAGAVVVLDVKNGDILTAASSTKGVASQYPPETVLALTELYEPGSIIKLITLSAAIEHHIDLSKLFPFECKGMLDLADNKIIHDWKAHGQVKDINQAMALSCNVAFARVGLTLNPADLMANLKLFGFDSYLNESSAPLTLGRIEPADMTNYNLANVSIGLQYLKMTPLHAAMIAASIANGGSAFTPRLLSHYQNVIGLPYAVNPPVEFRRFMSQSTAEKISAAMQEVVKNPDGTGHRAAVDGFPFAMKTGTAGDATKGFNAIVVGFAPVPDPKIAFSIVLEHAGKAEFEGARVTKLFLESIKGYI
ncbi:MAG: hypothetical protein C5B54_09705 [Acidobacteria bacterium]|nr:MAG: hypothetical protein C5B54_09705 [Acidobacteriota bacterium]